MNVHLARSESLLSEPPAEPEEQMPAFLTLEELRQNPDLLKPPECVVPHLAYRGRLVILAAPDKAGKSTLLGHAIAAVTGREHFLGSPMTLRHRRAVLVGLEEAVGDAVLRLSALDAVPDRVQLIVLPDSDVLQQTTQLLEEWPADLLVVDSLQELARVMLGTVPDDGDNAGWASVVRPLVAIARNYDVAIVLLHHVRRSDGQYRGAGEIAAAADALLEMSVAKPDENPNLRRITGRGRWSVQPFAVEMNNGRYELSGGAELSMDARILLYIEQNRGASKNTLRKAMGGRATAVDAAINNLLGRGALVNRGSDERMALYPPSTDPELGVI